MTFQIKRIYEPASPHDARREFARRYRKELVGNATLGELKRLGAHDAVTLLYGARDPKINHAVALLSILRTRARRPRAASSAG